MQLPELRLVLGSRSGTSSTAVLMLCGICCYTLSLLVFCSHGKFAVLLHFLGGLLYTFPEDIYIVIFKVEPLLKFFIMLRESTK